MGRRQVQRAQERRTRLRDEKYALDLSPDEDFYIGSFKEFVASITYYDFHHPCQWQSDPQLQKCLRKIFFQTGYFLDPFSCGDVERYMPAMIKNLLWNRAMFDYLYTRPYKSRLDNSLYPDYWEQLYTYCLGEGKGFVSIRSTKQERENVFYRRAFVYFYAKVMGRSDVRQISEAYHRLHFFHKNYPPLPFCDDFFVYSSSEILFVPGCPNENSRGECLPESIDTIMQRYETISRREQLGKLELLPANRHLRHVAKDLWNLFSFGHWRELPIEMVRNCLRVGEWFVREHFDHIPSIEVVRHRVGCTFRKIVKFEGVYDSFRYFLWFIVPYFAEIVAIADVCLNAEIGSHVRQIANVIYSETCFKLERHLMN